MLIFRYFLKNIKPCEINEKIAASALKMATVLHVGCVQLSTRLSRIEENAVLNAAQPAHLSPSRNPADPFLYESQPLLADGPTSGPLPHSFAFGTSKAPQPFDALSSNQSMESYQQAGPSSWDLLDLAGQGLQPYERLEEDARPISEVQPPSSQIIPSVPLLTELCPEAPLNEINETAAIMIEVRAGSSSQEHWHGRCGFSQLTPATIYSCAGTPEQQSLCTEPTSRA